MNYWRVMQAFLLIFVFLPLVVVATEISVIQDSTGKLIVHQGIVAGWLARAKFTDRVHSDGWSYLEVQSNVTQPDLIQAKAAGVAEGYITQAILYNFWRNTVQGNCAEKKTFCRKLQKFLKANLDWMQGTIKQKSDRDPYWHQVRLFVDQLTGVHQGYLLAAAENGQPAIDLFDFWYMNVFGDLEDLEQVLTHKLHKQYDGHQTGSFPSCSAIIKVLPETKDIYFSHVTWNTYQSMLRILKKYILNYHITSRSTSFVPGVEMTFSSYPGVIYSGDDFSLISSGLATMETTIGNKNVSLWKYIRPEGGVLEGIRATVANRLATNGRTWTGIFSRYNSGTYNNQWMVLDYTKFKPSRDLPDNLLWVLEQLPGFIVAKDKTDVLRNQSYWPSYNVPYFPKIFNNSGSMEDVLKYGDLFTYSHAPRARIFNRDHHKVTDLDSLMSLMRYNDYTHDPLSRCNCTPPYSAENAISARSDLNPKNGTYPFKFLGHRSHGGTDVKMTNSEMMKNLDFLAAAGPTYDQMPPFQWSQADFNLSTPHYGQPDLWMFDPVRTQWMWFFNSRMEIESNDIN